MENRNSGIGGTDISVLLGLNPWKTPFQLWQEKTGRLIEEPVPEARERMYWGTVLEDVVARHYSDRMNVRVQRVNGTLRHPDSPIAIAHIDRAVCAGFGSRARWNGRQVLGADRVLECKTAHAMAQYGADWGDPGTEAVPERYWLQCQWYLGITGLPVADLAVLFGGQQFAIYTIPADSGLFSDLLNEAVGWWERHIVADLPPDPASEAEARQAWRSHVAGKEQIVDIEVAEWVGELVEVKAEIKELKTQEQALRDRIVPAFGDAESISYMGRRLATFKQSKGSSKTDWKAVAEDFKTIDEAAYAIAVADYTEITEGARVLRLNTKE